MRITLVPLLVLATGCSIHFGGFEPRAWLVAERAFEVDAVDLAHVSCSTHNGNVTVRGTGTGGPIVVRTRTKAGGADEADAADALAAVEILHKRVDGGLALGWRWCQPYRDTWRASVTFEVAQPTDMPSRIETHNGRVRVEDLAASVTAVTYNGSLSLQRCSGEVRGTTHNGGVDADTAASDLSLVTHNGNMDVEVAGDGPVRGEIRSHNGGIRLRLGEGRSARLVCSTQNGRVTCRRELDRAERGRNFLVADLGSSDGRLAVETHNGSIRID